MTTKLVTFLTTLLVSTHAFGAWDFIDVETFERSAGGWFSPDGDGLLHIEARATDQAHEAYVGVNPIGLFHAMKLALLPERDKRQYAYWKGVTSHMVENNEVIAAAKIRYDELERVIVSNKALAAAHPDKYAYRNPIIKSMGDSPVPWAAGTTLAGVLLYNYFNDSGGERAPTTSSQDTTVTAGGDVIINNAPVGGSVGIPQEEGFTVEGAVEEAPAL